MLPNKYTTPHAAVKCSPPLSRGLLEFEATPFEREALPTHPRARVVGLEAAETHALVGVYAPRVAQQHQERVLGAVQLPLFGWSIDQLVVHGPRRPAV